MKYGLGLDQKKLHGSYQIIYHEKIYQEKMAIPTNPAEFVGIAIFSPRSWNNLLQQSKPFVVLHRTSVFATNPEYIQPQVSHCWWVSLSLCLGWWSHKQYRLCSVSCTGKGQVASQGVCVFVECTQRKSCASFRKRTQNWYLLTPQLNPPFHKEMSPDTSQIPNLAYSRFLISNIM